MPPISVRHLRPLGPLPHTAPPVSPRNRQRQTCRVCRPDRTQRTVPELCTVLDSTPLHSKLGTPPITCHCHYHIASTVIVPDPRFGQPRVSIRSYIFHTPLLLTRHHSLISHQPPPPPSSLILFISTTLRLNTPSHVLCTTTLISCSTVHKVSHPSPPLLAELLHIPRGLQPSPSVLCTHTLTTQRAHSAPFLAAQNTSTSLLRSSEPSVLRTDSPHSTVHLPGAAVVCNGHAICRAHRPCPPRCPID